MKTKIITIFVLLVLLCISMFGIVKISTSSHEKVHLEIMKSFGHTNAYIEYNHFGINGLTHYNDTKEITQSEKNLHNMNEIVSYNIESLIYTIFVCTFIICFVLIFKEN